jgi:signal transduction histidine kinase
MRARPVTYAGQIDQQTARVSLQSRFAGRILRAFTQPPDSARKLLASGRGMSGDSRFGARSLREEDYARFNHWLWVTRLRSIAGLLVLATVLTWSAQTPVLRWGAIMLICAADLAPSGLYHRWLGTRRHLRTLAYVQLAADTLAIVAGLLFVQESPVLFHFVLLLVVVPASMIEWQCGLVFATLASVGHFLLLLLNGSDWVSVGGLLPPASFLLIASQSRFYAQHLAQKNIELAAAAESLDESNQRLEEEGAISAALLRAAQALTKSLDPREILERLNDVVRQALHSDFSITLLLDEPRGVYRVAAASGSEPDVLDEVRTFEFPCHSAAIFARTAQEGLVAVEDRSSALFPRALMERWHVTSFLSADLQRAGSSVGVLAAGFNDRAGPFSQREMRLMRSIAQQATVALENARLVEGLRAASRLKSEFIGTMSHELRSPLNVVIGYVDLLLGGDLGTLVAEQRDALQSVQMHALQLLELIQETLDVNRLEAGMLPVDFETFPVREFIEDVKQSIPADWHKDEVALTFEVDPHFISVHSDRVKLKKVLRNLIHNAMKFTDRGSVSVQVSADNGWSDFSVRDTGIGIHPEALPVIFEMFRQADGSSTRRHGGVGLGLYIVKQLVRGLGGEIDVASTVGAGSTFRVRLRRSETKTSAQS